MFTLGRISAPPFSADFPAQEISTELNWDDLVLSDDVLAQIEDIKGWIEYNAALLNDLGMAKKIKPGYRALFHGSPGTGKTLTATLLGKFELAGGSIINVVHHACLKMLATGPERIIQLEDALQGIRREVEKEGKVFKNILNDQLSSSKLNGCSAREKCVKT